MTVVYIVFAVAGWAWLGVVGAYMGWRIYRERMEGGGPATPRRRRTVALQEPGFRQNTAGNGPEV